MMTFEEILDRFPGPRTGPDGNGGWMVTCPCHPDMKKPSLHISPGNGKGPLFFDFGSCTTDEILAEVGLSWKDILPSRKAAGRSASRVSGKVTRYEVRDPAGKHVATHVRKDLRNGEKAVWWEQPDGTKGLKGMKMKDLPLYGVERLSTAPTDVPVVVTEGEKAAEALLSNGVVAVGTVTGSSGTPGNNALRPLLDRPIFLWPDNDDGGREHMKHVGAILIRLGHQNVRVIEWPGASPKGDAADFFQLKGALRKFHALRETAEPFEAAEAVQEETTDLILDPTYPLDCAREFLDRCHTRDGAPVLLHHRGEFFTWTGTDYRPATNDGLRCGLWGFLDGAFKVKKIWDSETVVPFNPTKHRVSDVFDGLRAAAHVPETVEPPAFLDDPARDARSCLAIRNGVLDVSTEELNPHSPRFFNVGAADYDFNPKAKAPTWEAFLDSIFEEDRESRDTLEEILGLFLIPETKFQKLFLLVGPRRSGKGTIGRLLPQLLGPRRVATPTIGGLGEQFGLQQLLGKSVAVIGDMRLRANAVEVADRLLGISGDDGIEVPRKYLPDWNGRLGVRFLLLSNELPHLNDPSGAFSSRFIIIQLTESFLGREDHDLDAKLAAERPGILNLCLAELKRLRERGRFHQPSAGAAAVEALEALASPHKVFLEEMVEWVPGAEVPVDTVFLVWEAWCARNGRKFVGDKARLGRDLRTASDGKLPKPVQRGTGKKKIRVYPGLRMK